VVVVSYSGKEINAKLVYYGAGLCGKTTNLEAIYEAVPDTSRGKMVSMKTQSDRTLFFDLLPLDLGEIMGFKTRFLLYTVPGQVFYNATRKLVLKGADAIVFVADSEVGKMEENKESLANLRTNLAEYNLSLDEIPWVLQYNKRDLPNIYTIDELNAEMNPGNKVPAFEAVAVKGKGVFETFRGVSHLLMEKVTKDLRRTPFGTSGGARPAAAPAVAPAAAPNRPAAPEPVRAVHAPQSRPVAPEPEPNPMTVDYGREISLPGDMPLPAAPQRVERLQVEPPPVFTPPPPMPTRAAAPEPRMPMGPPAAPAPRAAAPPPPTTHAAPRVVAAETNSANEMVVPIQLPRNGPREIVLKIVLKLDDAA
jgi:signal recognition particle receptor subunit beta